MAPEYWQSLSRDVDERVASENQKAPKATRPTFFQPDANGPIYKLLDDEAPLIWLNWFYVEGRYYHSASAYESARKRMIERDHALGMFTRQTLSSRHSRPVSP